MPVNLSIKNVPDALAERLRQRAVRNRRSLQGGLMAILDQARLLLAFSNGRRTGPDRQAQRRAAADGPNSRRSRPRMSRPGLH